MLDERTKEFIKEVATNTLEIQADKKAIIQEEYEKKFIRRDFDFRFPFILKESDIMAFDNCIKERLNNKYNDSNNLYSLKFRGYVQFKNGNVDYYYDIEKLINVTSKYTISSIFMSWIYKVKSETIDVPLSYEIYILYETQSDVSAPTIFLFNESGNIKVEGEDMDWTNETLSRLKVLINSTKMPFWWYSPKKLISKIATSTNTLYLVLFFMILFGFGYYYQINNTNSALLEQLQHMTDINQKIQLYIEYQLSSRMSLDNHLTFVALIVFVVFICLLLIGKHLFPNSSIQIGSNKNKQKNILTAYAFGWGAIITTLLGLIITMIIKI